MPERVIPGERGIIVAPTADAILSIGDLGKISQIYGEIDGTSAFILNARVAYRVGGLGIAADTVHNNLQGDTKLLYDFRLPTAAEQHLIDPSAQALRDLDFAGVRLHPASDPRAEAMIDDLQERQVEPIVDLDVLPEAQSFNVDEVWKWIAGPAVQAIQSGVHTIVVPSNAPESVSRLSDRLIENVGIGRFALLAEFTDADNLINTIAAAHGSLHVIIPTDIRYEAHRNNPQPSKQYQIAQFALQQFDPKNLPVN